MVGKTYRRKPVSVTAIMWTGDNYGEVKEFLEDKCYIMRRCLFVNLEHGTSNANIGEYLVKMNDQIFIMNKEMFENTYEEV